MDSALHLAKLMDDKSLLKKVQLLSGLAFSNIVDNADDQNSSLTSINVSQFEESLREANKKFELVKQQITKNKRSSDVNCETEEAQVWTLAKSWNPCPIGMLPHFIGSSGCLPVLDVIDNETVLDVIDNEEHNQVSARKENWKLIKHGAKRDAPSDIQLLHNSTAKKMRETEQLGKLNSESPME
jgi:ribosomal biogenesis protein LAS1